MRKYIAFLSVMLLLAVGLAIVAKLLFDGSPADGFSRRLGELLLQLALIVIIGALVTAGIKLLADNLSDERAKLEHEHEERLDFLRRLRRVHITIAYAQRLMRAHDSADTYTKQLRKLMLVAPELEEINEDLKAAGDLFSPHDQAIIEGIEDIIDFLQEGADEYEEFHRCELDAEAGRPFRTILAEADMKWVSEFISPSGRKHPTPRLPARYDAALTRSKHAMRFHIYGQ